MSKFQAIADNMAAKNLELANLLKEFNARMQEEFVKLTRYFFEETGVQAVIWNQYTPSFNDGDPCTFTLGEPVFVTKNFSLDPDFLNEENEEVELMSASEYEDDFYGPVPIGYYGKRENHELTSVCDLFHKLLSANEDMLERLYGEYGKTVYLTKDKVETAEYECGY